MKKIRKTVTYIPRLTAGQYIFLFYTCWLVFKNFTDLQKVVQTIVHFTLAKKIQNAKYLKIKYQQRSVKLKCLLVK